MSLPLETAQNAGGRKEIYFSFRSGVLKEKLAQIQKHVMQIIYKGRNGDYDNEDVIISDLSLDPKFWVSKWVDLTNDIGFGYQLSDNTVGTISIDCNKIMGLKQAHVECYDDQGNIFALDREVKFLELMEKELLMIFMLVCKDASVMKANMDSRRCLDDNTPRPFLHTFWISPNATVMHLSNGTLQLNFNDNIKILVCPNKNALTVVDENNYFLSYNIFDLQISCPAALYNRLTYLKVIIDNLIQNQLY